MNESNGLGTQSASPEIWTVAALFDLHNISLWPPAHYDHGPIVGSLRAFLIGWTEYLGPEYLSWSTGRDHHGQILYVVDFIRIDGRASPGDRTGVMRSTILCRIFMWFVQEAQHTRLVVNTWSTVCIPGSVRTRVIQMHTPFGFRFFHCIQIVSNLE